MLAYVSLDFLKNITIQGMKYGSTQTKWNLVIWAKSYKVEQSRASAVYHRENKRMVAKEKEEEIARENGVYFMETSANKTNVNIEKHL